MTTIELRKPEASTPEAFTKLAKECRNSKKVSIAKLGLDTGQSSTTILRFTNGQFAKQDFGSMSTKKLLGSVGSLARFCQYFSLDLAACFEALGIPSEYLDLPEAKDPTLVYKLSNPLVTKDIWEKVEQMINVVGPLPMVQIIALIDTIRKNADPM